MATAFFVVEILLPDVLSSREKSSAAFHHCGRQDSSDNKQTVPSKESLIQLLTTTLGHMMAPQLISGREECPTLSGNVYLVVY